MENPGSYCEEHPSPWLKFDFVLALFLLGGLNFFLEFHPLNMFHSKKLQ